MNFLSKINLKDSYFNLKLRKNMVLLISMSILKLQSNIGKTLHSKLVFSFLLYFVFSNLSAQVYGSFPYAQSFTSGVQPPEVSLFLPQRAGGVNSVTFVSNGAQLTKNANSQFGAFYLNDKKFSSINGINIEFEFGMYGGTGADGLCVFLFDAAIASPVIGAVGGGMGYTYFRTNQQYSAGRQTGLSGGYLGIGIDNYGNYKRSVYQTDQRVSGIPSASFTSGSSQITLRGAKGVVIDAAAGMGDGFTGYPVLRAQSTLSGTVGGAELNSSTGGFVFSPGLTTNSFNLGTTTLAIDPNNPDYRKVYISLIPNSLGGYNITVKIQHGLITSTVIDNYWYKTSVTYTENANSLITDFNTSNQIGPNTIHTISTAPPANFRIGFGASTGGLNNIHLIRNLVVSLPYAAVAENDSFTYCTNGSGTIFPLTNDIAYSGPISGTPVASSSNIDLTSFKFVDDSGVSHGQSYFVAGQGTWIYNLANGEVTFTSIAGYTGTPTVNYEIKGLTAPYNDDGYRSLPSKITASPVSPSSISRQPVSQIIRSGNNTSFSFAFTGGSGAKNYQWQVSTNNGANWANVSDGGVYSGAASSTLSLTNIPYSLNGNLYRVLFTELCQDITSNSALLTVEETDLSVLKTVSNASQAVNSNVTFTITATNNGPSAATNVIVNDVLPSGYTFVSATPSVGTWVSPNWTVGNLANGTNATLSIVARVNAAGSYTNTATLTGNEKDPQLPNNTSTVTVTPVNLIDAAPDSNTVPVNGVTGGPTGINVFNNDTLNGNPVNPSDVALTSTPKGPLTVNPDGTVSVAPNTPAGSYTVDYTICEKLNPTNCNTGTVTVNIVCMFNVVCPTFVASKVECYDLLPADGSLTIPQFQLLGNGDGVINETPSGVVEIRAINGASNGCGSVVVRTYTITEYADLNNNNTRDLGEDTIINQVSCTQNILVKDTKPPVLVTALSSVINVACNAITTAPALLFTDNCSAASSIVVNLREVKSSVLADGTYTITRTWTADDACGNRTTVSQRVNVQVTDYLRTMTTEAQCNIDSNLTVNVSDAIKTKFSEVLLEGGTFTDVSMSGGLVNSTGIFSPYNLSDGEYVIRYENNDSNCPRVIDVKIPVSTRPTCTEDNCEKIIFHNAISPNGDGMNEEFIIDNVTSECYKENTVEIFNRWGVKVFDTLNYDNSTNTFKGFSEGRTTIKQSSSLPNGTYYYIFKYTNIEGNVSSKAGWLYLSANK